MKPKYNWFYVVLVYVGCVIALGFCSWWAALPVTEALQKGAFPLRRELTTAVLTIGFNVFFLFYYPWCSYASSQLSISESEISEPSLIAQNSIKWEEMSEAYIDFMSITLKSRNRRIFISKGVYKNSKEIEKFVRQEISKSKNPIRFFDYESGSELMDKSNRLFICLVVCLTIIITLYVFVRRWVYHA